MSTQNEYFSWIMDLLAITGGLFVIMIVIYMWWFGRPRK